MTAMKDKFLSALSERTRTCSSDSKVVLPTGVVRTDELTQVLRALADAQQSKSDDDDIN
jgi:hypothetical protein